MEVNQGYTITQAILFDNGWGFAWATTRQPLIPL